MAVGDDDRLDVLGALAQVGEVGQHEVDPEHLGGREPQPGVDDDDPAVVLDDRHVLADLAQAAERQDAQLRCAPLASSSPAGRVVIRLLTGAVPWRSSIARTVAVSLLVELDVRQPRRADVDAEQVQRGLDRAGQRRDRQVAVDVLQAGVDLAPALGLVDHPAHLLAEQVAGDEDAARLAEVEHVGEQVVVAGVDLQAVDLGEVVAGWPA